MDDQFQFVRSKDGLCGIVGHTAYFILLIEAVAQHLSATCDSLATETTSATKLSGHDILMMYEQAYLLHEAVISDVYHRQVFFLFCKKESAEAVTTALEKYNDWEGKFNKIQTERCVSPTSLDWTDHNAQLMTRFADEPTSES